MLPNEEQQQYTVSTESERREVVDVSGRVAVTCRDQASATDYAVLLNEAYRLGYKAGYRAAKAPSNKPGS